MNKRARFVLTFSNGTTLTGEEDIWCEFDDSLETTFSSWIEKHWSEFLVGWTPSATNYKWTILHNRQVLVENADDHTDGEIFDKKRCCFTLEYVDVAKVLCYNAHTITIEFTKKQKTKE